MSEEQKTGGAYFAPPSSPELFSSGCTLLDCVLGGGYPLGRMVNIVGDRSTGKTLLAIEACAEFARKFPEGKIYYREAEAAFDTLYAEALGMPLDRVEFEYSKDEDSSFLTVEDMFEDLERILKELSSEDKALYIVDSLDALSDRAEQERAIDKGSYGQDKAKKLSEMFRRLAGKLGNRNVCVIIVSQVRDNIGVAFGEKYRRSGGHSMDFYASQILWLANLGQIKKTKKGVTRTIGIKVKALCKKNKVSEPFRECEFPLIFGFGVNDLDANLKFLKDLDSLGLIRGLAIEDSEKVLKTGALNLDQERYRDYNVTASGTVKRKWAEIEEAFTPKIRKY